MDIRGDIRWNVFISTQYWQRGGFCFTNQAISCLKKLTNFQSCTLFRIILSPYSLCGRCYRIIGWLQHSFSVFTTPNEQTCSADVCVCECECVCVCLDKHSLKTTAKSSHAHEHLRRGTGGLVCKIWLPCPFISQRLCTSISLYVYHVFFIAPEKKILRA